MATVGQKYGISGSLGSGWTFTGTLANPTFSGTRTQALQTLAAAGATQGNAGAITGSTVYVTVTASTQGVRLPAAAAGLQVTVLADPAVGVKVYPASGAIIGAAATNAAHALAKNTVAIYTAVDATHWRVVRGA